MAPAEWAEQSNLLGRVAGMAGTPAERSPADRVQAAVEALQRIAFLLERSREPTYRVRAFRGAASAIGKLDDVEVLTLATRNELRDLPGVGEVTERVIMEALAGQRPAYLERLEEAGIAPVAGAGAALRAALRGDCHTHSDWSDGGSPIREMAEAAREVGHEYIVLTDHSQRLKIARGLDAARLEQQLDVVAELNEALHPFRILTGMEVDILEDGELDMGHATLSRLDVVVASVHSKLRMDERAMTRRMLRAMANPDADILGHCTGRIVVGRGRPQSTFDADAVFSACVEHDKAVEINSRPERLDPPRALLRLAVEKGCRIAIDSDAHAPGQLDWQPYGCARAEECGVPEDRVVNTMPADELVAWAASHDG